jgi:hypothetical protein
MATDSGGVSFVATPGTYHTMVPGTVVRYQVLYELIRIAKFSYEWLLVRMFQQCK